MTDWPFGADADQHDPLTKLRIAVTGSHPGWYYLVAFDSESEARPTDAEAAMLASFLNEYKDHWYGQSGFRRTMEERPLDVDGGANGVIFHKFGTGDWGYRRHSYTQGWTWSVVGPALRDHPDYRNNKNVGPYSLADLMDRIHTIGDDQPMQRWLNWKSAHAGVFEAVAR